MSQNRGDTSLLPLLRAEEWPPRESDEIGALPVELGVHQSNLFRRATITRRAAGVTVRAGTPQNTSSGMAARALCALAMAGRDKAHLILFTHKTRSSRCVPTHTARTARASPQRPRTTTTAPTLLARARACELTPSVRRARTRAPVRRLSLRSDDDEGPAEVDDGIGDNARAQLKRH
jgi:hypothetical protein